MDHGRDMRLSFTFLQRSSHPALDPLLQQPLVVRNRALREPRDMAGDGEIRHRGLPLTNIRKQRTGARTARLRLQHISGCTGNPAFSQGASQRRFIHDATTRDIDDQRLGPHSPQLLLRDEVDRIVILGQTDTDDGGALQRLVETHTPFTDARAILALADQHLLEPDRLGQLRDPGPKRPVSQDRERLLATAQRRARRPEFRERAFINPLTTARDGVMHLHDALAGTKVERQKVLAHGVDVSRRAFRDGDAALRAVGFVDPADADGHDGQDAEMRRRVHLLGRHGGHARNHYRGVLDALRDFRRLCQWVHVDRVWEVEGRHLRVDAF